MLAIRRERTGRNLPLRVRYPREFFRGHVEQRQVQIATFLVAGHQHAPTVGRNVRAEVELLALMRREVRLTAARDIYSVHVAVIKPDAGTVGIQDFVIGAEGDDIPALLRIFFLGQLSYFVRDHVNDR